MRNLAKPRNRVITAQPREKYYALRGGEDLISPPATVAPGLLSFSLNYECDTNGKYRRIDGYEAFDGHPKPSAASYWILDFTNGSAAMTQGDTVTGAGGATGTLIEQVLESGTYAGSDAAGYLVLSNVSGTFVDDENLQVSAVTEAVADGTATERGIIDETVDAGYWQDAIEYARDQIGAVPGSGSILGVWGYNGTVYAFRNNSGGTAAVMYKSSTAGWVACDLGRTVAFTSGGVYQVAENDTITGATSGATAVVKRIILTSGTWAGGDAAGTFVLYTQTGTFQSENLNVGANLNVATIGANSAVVALTASGSYRFINHNFYGATDKFRMYGVDGVNKGFEWDGTTFVQITTGMTTDKPTHVAAFKAHLFYGFAGGSLQASEPGDPYGWSVVTGANEIGIGDDITGLMVAPGGVMAVFARNSTHILSGTGSTDWALSALDENTGAIEWTLQKLGSGIFLDDRGLTSLTTVQEYGDFATNNIVELMKPYLDSKMALAQSSVAVRAKNQYRLYFSDMYGLCVTFKNNKVVGATRLLYDKLPVCVVSCEDANGNEELYFGSTDGFVYQLDKGNSFNGEELTAVARTHFNHCGYPSNKKRFRRMIPEISGPSDAGVYAFATFSYGEEENPEQALDAYSGYGILGLSELNDFRLGGAYVGFGTIPITGSGTNIAFTFFSNSTYADPHTLHGLTIHFDIRGLRR